MINFSVALSADYADRSQPSVSVVKALSMSQCEDDCLSGKWPPQLNSGNTIAILRNQTALVVTRQPDRPMQFYVEKKSQQCQAQRPTPSGEDFHIYQCLMPRIPEKPEVVHSLFRLYVEDPAPMETGSEV